jgi:hypothetical protein
MSKHGMDLSKNEVTILHMLLDCRGHPEREIAKMTRKKASNISKYLQNFLSEGILILGKPRFEMKGRKGKGPKRVRVFPYYPSLSLLAFDDIVYGLSEWELKPRPDLMGGTITSISDIALTVYFCLMDTNYLYIMIEKYGRDEIKRALWYDSNWMIGCRYDESDVDIRVRSDKIEEEFDRRVDEILVPYKEAIIGLLEDVDNQV